MQDRGDDFIFAKGNITFLFAQTYDLSYNIAGFDLDF